MSKPSSQAFHNHFSLLVGSVCNFYSSDSPFALFTGSAFANSSKSSLETLWGRLNSSVESLEVAIEQDKPHQEICMQLGTMKQAFFSLKTLAPNEMKYMMYGAPIVAMEGFCISGVYKSGAFKGKKIGFGVMGWLTYGDLDALAAVVLDRRERHFTIKNMLNTTSEYIENME